jgi:hypothetical protein
MSLRNDSAYIQDILPLHCQRYLKWKNWKFERDIGDLASVWINSTKEFENIEILLPLDTRISDYKLRMSEFLETLHVAENRPHDSIISDLKSLSTDTLRITLNTAKGHEVSFANAAKIMDRSLDMLAATANSLIEPKPHYRSRPKPVQQYIDSLELGHTERGSFVFKIHSPVTPALMSEMNLENQEIDPPFSRKVMCQLEEILKKSIAAANRGDAQHFKDGVKQGISSNFCEALADVVNTGSSEVGFDFTWSLSRPRSPSTNRIVIRKDVAEILKEAGNYLKANLPEEEVEIVGYVIGLDKGLSQLDGDIKVIDMSDAQNRTIYLKLDNKQYQEAIKAHAQGTKVKIVGDVQKKFNKSWMTNIIKFLSLEQ